MNYYCHVTLSRYGIYLLGISTNWRPSITLHSELKVHSEQLIERTNAGEVEYCSAADNHPFGAAELADLQKSRIPLESTSKAAGFIDFFRRVSVHEQSPLVTTHIHRCWYIPPTRNDQSTDRPRGL